MNPPESGADFDVIVIGGGQAALAVAYYLRRTGLRFALLDDQDAPGGSWLRAWPSLRLFSPAQWSSLPGWMMPRDPSEERDSYPSRDATVAYLAGYEQRYAIPVIRPSRVTAVRRDGALLIVDASGGPLRARAVVSATGTWANPVIPLLPGEDRFRGTVLHSAVYAGANAFEGRRVIVVGGGNSGAQIVAELSGVAEVTWATREPPRFLPDHVDGRYLFEQATARYKAIQEGRTPDPPQSLGDVVAVPSVREARARGALDASPMFSHFTESGVVWPDGREQAVEVLIFATGFRAALHHLEPLGLGRHDGRIAVQPGGAGTRAAGEPRLWLVGYGDWTGFASATLIGVGRSARATVDEIVAALAPLPAD